MNTLEEEIERLRKENLRLIGNALVLAVKLTDARRECDQLRNFLEALKEYPERTSVAHVYGGGY